MRAIFKDIWQHLISAYMTTSCSSYLYLQSSKPGHVLMHTHVKPKPEHVHAYSYETETQTCSCILILNRNLDMFSCIFTSPWTLPSWSCCFKQKNSYRLSCRQDHPKVASKQTRVFPSKTSLSTSISPKRRHVHHAKVEAKLGHSHFLTLRS